MSGRDLPAPVRSAGACCARDLDVRPVLAKGGDPFHLIMRTVQELGEHEALHLVVGFEPKPLYAVMQAAGRKAHTESEGDVVHVWFYTDPDAPKPVAMKDDGERVPLLDPIELDVSGMEPPLPMITILEKLGELGPGAQLLVHHHREPVLLYDKLALRGYAARTEKRGEGDYLVRIGPAWAFEDRPAGEGRASGGRS